MTREEREEAIDILYGIRADNLDLDNAYTKSKYNALDMAIKALEQELCSDTISRQAVLDKKELVELEDGQSFYCISPEDVETLPSVTPQPKTGHWIIDIKDSNYCFCSECNDRFNIDHLKFCWDEYAFPPHCPNCGERMVEPQESEV